MKMCVMACSPLPKSHIYWPSGWLLWNSSQNSLTHCLPGYNPQIDMNKVFHFFLRLTINFLWTIEIGQIWLGKKCKTCMQQSPDKTPLKTGAYPAAKSLQLCPTLCDPVDSSPPGSPVPGILQARTLEWVAIAFSNAWKWKVKVKALSCIWLFTTPWTAAYLAPPSMGFSRQEYWSGVPLPSPRKMVQMNLFAGQEYRHRCRERICGHRAERGGWEELGD